MESFDNRETNYNGYDFAISGSASKLRIIYIQRMIQLLGYYVDPFHDILIDDVTAVNELTYSTNINTEVAVDPATSTGSSLLDSNLKLVLVNVNLAGLDVFMPRHSKSMDQIQFGIDSVTIGTKRYENVSKNLSITATCSG